MSAKGSVIVKPGDVVIVFAQGKKREGREWKTGDVHELIHTFFQKAVSIFRA